MAEPVNCWIKNIMGNNTSAQYCNFTDKIIKQQDERCKSIVTALMLDLLKFNAIRLS